jgi:hypothetical protein
VTPANFVRDRASEIPPTLAAHLHETIANAEQGAASDVPDRLIDAGIALVAEVAAAEPMSRSQALDLLAADALLTYAFEAAADEPQTLVARADAAMLRIAEIGQ